jgi:hypothetical protein
MGLLEGELHLVEWELQERYLLLRIQYIHQDIDQYHIHHLKNTVCVTLKV